MLALEQSIESLSTGIFFLIVDAHCEVCVYQQFRCKQGIVWGELSVVQH